MDITHPLGWPSVVCSWYGHRDTVQVSLNPRDGSKPWKGRIHGLLTSVCGNLLQFAIEIVDLPINSMVIYPLNMLIHPLKMLIYPLKMLIYPGQMLIYPLKMLIYPWKMLIYPLKMLIYPWKMLIYPWKMLIYPWIAWWFSSSQTVNVYQRVSP